MVIYIFLYSLYDKCNFQNFIDAFTNNINIKININGNSMWFLDYFLREFVNNYLNIRANFKIIFSVGFERQHSNLIFWNCNGCGNLNKKKKNYFIHSCRLKWFNI